MQEAVKETVRYYNNERGRLENLEKLSKKGLTIVQEKGYYKDRLKALEDQVKNWKEKYPEFFI